MWKSLPTRARVVLTISAAAVLAILAVLLWLYIAKETPAVYVPGPTSVHTVYEPRWRGRVKPEVRLVPVNARIEFLPRDQVVERSKIPDAPDDIIALGQVPPHGGKTTVFATLKEGKDNVLRGGLDYRQEAMPFWQLKREFHGGAYYGVVGPNLAEVHGRVNFLRTGPVNWNGQGRIGIERDGGRLNAALLIGVEY